MRKIHIYPLIFCLLCISCMEPEIDKSLLRIEGLNGLYITVPGFATEYGISNQGPYEDGDTLLIKVPSSEEAPVDISALFARASLGHNAVLTPALAGMMDFSEPVDIYVTDGANVSTHYVIKVVPIPPKMVLKKLWYKNLLDMGFVNFDNVNSIAVSRDELVVCAYNPTILKVLDKATGDFIKDIPLSHPWISQINTDDTGNVLATSWRIYGSYFECKKIDIDAGSETLLGYYTSDEVPDFVGDRVTLTGNIDKGTAFIYATGRGDNGYYMLELKDGQKVSGSAIKYSTPISENWERATVKRKTTDDESELLISTLHTLDGEHSRFVVIKNQFEFKEMDPLNFPSSILDYDYFKMGEEEFVAMAVQSGNGTPVEMRVYNITKDEYMELVPGDSEYSNLMCFTSEQILSGGYTRNADVAVQVDGNLAYLYLFTTAANGTSGGGVLAYQLKYTAQ
ncbi:hypothetical protein [Parabacteroides bouchesdurhonensis]|uniref:hypothetical protein n=1 Tax=Parabacteroides bouchesdurhonensis TaxID=1936995 RepID=UPI00131A7431|nr:hypothetical protein [Parabacteroides bouchesdurhonensis]